MSNTQRHDRPGCRELHQHTPVATLLQELFESTSTPLYLLFLDWQQAFDRLSREGLLSALRRIGCTPHFLEVIGSIYQDPKFVVRTSQGTSQEYAEGSGIRQGCPLSPYLFLIVMTALFHDIHTLHQLPLSKHRPTATTFDEVLFADDTVLLTRESHQMHTLLQDFEKVTMIPPSQRPKNS